ncbi:MAG TPA: GrpB family protein, partial [Clostridia bacterium]|nr:GrpB family protein [Clostridia bacterium]
EAVQKYSQLKLELAKKFPNDIDRYIDGKTDLINSFLKKEGMSLEGLEAIQRINKNQ